MESARLYDQQNSLTDKNIENTELNTPTVVKQAKPKNPQPKVSFTANVKIGTRVPFSANDVNIITNSRGARVEVPLTEEERDILSGVVNPPDHEPNPQRTVAIKAMNALFVKMCFHLKVEVSPALEAQFMRNVSKMKFTIDECVMKWKADFALYTTLEDLLLADQQAPASVTTA
jgi:hypothetical protein